MWYPKPLQSKHPLAPTGEVVGGSTTHPPYADDDGVETTGILDAHLMVFPFGDWLVGTLAFVSRAGSGTSSESRSSS